MSYGGIGAVHRLQNIERLRHDTAYMNALGANLIPDPTTAGDFCRRFDEHQITELLECIKSNACVFAAIPTSR